MALFNRKNKNNTAVPAEIQEYYQAEKRDRTGIAWLLAFATLVVTILLAAGIFFAGRWAYRKIAGSDGQDNSSQTAQNENQQEQQSEENSGQSEEDRRAAEEEQQRTEQEAEEAEDRRAEEEREEQAREETERRENAQVPDELPSGDSDAEDRQAASGSGSIPETGPGDTLAIFFAVSILGYLGHRLFAAKKA